MTSDTAPELSISNDTPASVPPADVPSSTALLPDIIINACEARVLGSLIEKEFTTPDIYPLSLNSLTNACNQRNNRAPVLALSEGEVEIALNGLRDKRLAALFSGADARVPKFRQTIDNQFPIENSARALIAELLLRGPQTTAELRARTERMQPISDLAETERLLQDLAERPSGPLVRLLPRQPGQKESRWTELLTGEPVAANPASNLPSLAPLPVPEVTPEIETRLSSLEAEVASLRAELAALRAALGET